MKKKTYAEKRFFEWHEDELSVSLRAKSGSYGGGSEVFVVESSQKVDDMSYQKITGTLSQGAHPGSYNGQDAYNDMLVTDVMKEKCKSIVRRLTPLECTRLQGFPDGWVEIGDWVDSNGKKHKDADSPKYKALGNSLAVGYANNKSGFWCWLARRICAQYEREITIGSLFDGIGGFPLAFESAGAKAVWASEIEEFCVAVTKKHFPEKEDT